MARSSQKTDSNEAANSTGPKSGQRRGGDESSRDRSNANEARMGSSSKSSARPDRSKKEPGKNSLKQRNDRDD